MKTKTMLASFPSFIGDVLANVLRYRHEDVPVLIAQLVRDYPQFRADVIRGGRKHGLRFFH